MNQNGTNDGLTGSADSSCNAQNVPKTNLNVTDSVKAPICDKEAQPSSSGLKSSLKSLGAFRRNHSVSWADEKTDGVHNRTLCEFDGKENKKDTCNGFGMIDKSIDGNDDDDNVIRFASAEACAVALSQAAEAVASGNLMLLMLGGLLDTMSFLDALPSLRMKQWQVFVLLFVEALSVSQIPAIAPNLTGRRFFQKVFDDAQITTEEYEVLKDLMLPLGRVSQFATQSGG